MPRIPEREWKKYTDPDSEEYSPTPYELEDERLIKDTVLEELADIEDELDRPTRDIYTGEENKFGAAAPETFWDRFSYLRIDYLGKVKDTELKKDLADRISKVESRVYRQFLPFIDSLINIYGWENSPPEEHAPRPKKINPADIESQFNQARALVQKANIPETERDDFLSELDLLEKKLGWYQNEPTLFTFEKIEQELYRDILGYNHLRYVQRGRLGMDYIGDGKGCIKRRGWKGLSQAFPKVSPGSQQS